MIKYKINCCFGCVLFIHVACLCICVWFDFFVVCLHVCAYAFKFKVRCESALGPGSSRLPYYCGLFQSSLLLDTTCVRF